MAEYCIAITGLNAADVPCSGINVVRSLKQGFCAGKDSQIKIIGLAYELLCSASYVEGLFDEVYYVPFPHQDEDKYLSRISEITEKRKIDVLIPNLDFEIAVMSKLEPELRDLGIRLLIPSESALTQSKKENLGQLEKLAGIEVPYSIVFSDRRQITQSAANFAYPLVVKAANGEAYVVYSLEEAIVFSNRLIATWGAPLIMQKFIKGDEYSVAAVADRRQRILGSVCMKKILKSRNGATWIGVTTKDEALISIVKRFIERLRWVGPLELEFIKEQTSGKYFLIEVNPRFPTWIHLTTVANCNLPLAVVKAALHQKIEPYPGYKNGILFARSAMDVTCDISQLGKLATKKELFYYEDKKCSG